MTPHELLQAKIAEVRRRAGVDGTDKYIPTTDYITHAFDVEREGWTPTVDPDLLLAREIAAMMRSPEDEDLGAYINGSRDEWEAVTQPLAIIRAHRAKQAGSGG